MKKYPRFGLLLVTLFMLAACAGGGLTTELTSCTFPDTVRTPAPSFVCDQSLDGYPVSRLTSVAPSDSSSSDRMEQGRMAIQIQLAEEWLQRWYGDAVTSEQQALMNSWLMEELRVVRTRNSPTGTLWMLAGLPHTEYEARTLFEQLEASERAP